MLDGEIYLKIKRLAPKVSFQEPMKLHTAWHIGGPAEIFVEPDGLESLAKIITFAKQYKIPVTTIGNGSNILVRDCGIRGMVIKIGNGFSGITLKEEIIKAQAGVKLAQLVRVALEAGIGGFEFLAGIPGTVGGAVVMNAGAYGKAISDICESVLFMDSCGNTFLLPKEELGFGYRKSIFQNSYFIVLEIICRGKYCNPQIIYAKVEEILNKRKKTQPLGYPSAGSVFKNPPGMSAGYLIEQAGGKGMRVNDAVVSDLHANFIVNLGQATACDVLELIEGIQVLVEKRFKVKLDLEIQVLGESCDT